MNLLPAKQSRMFLFSGWGCALFLIVLGSRLAVFSYAGSPVPYYDQWVAEFNSTLLSIAAGNGFETLLRNHNEHTLLTTKTLTLLGYTINGYWDVPFLILCSATVRALTAVWTFQLIADSARPGTRLLLWVLCAVMFVAPFSGFNLLNGMQVCFYLTDFALLWSLRATTNWTNPVTGGLALVGGTLFGVASLAAAIAIPACTLAAHFFQRRSRPGFWPAWILSAVIALGFIVSRSRISEAIAAHQAPKTFEAMADFWFLIMSWPVGLAPIGGLVTLLCTIALVIAFNRDRCRTASTGVILGLGVYAAMNAAFMAVSRNPSEWHMRHWETNAFLPLALLAFGLRLADLNVFTRSVSCLTAVVALCYVFYAGNLIRKVNWPYLNAAHETRSAALEHYRTILSQQDFHGESERFYTLGKKLGSAFIDDPIGRFSVHPGILENLVRLNYRPLALLSPEIIPIRSPSPFAWFTKQMIACGWVIFLLGIIMAVATGWKDRYRPAAPTTP